MDNSSTIGCMPERRNALPTTSPANRTTASQPAARPIQSTRPARLKIINGEPRDRCVPYFEAARRGEQVEVQVAKRGGKLRIHGTRDTDQLQICIARCTFQSY